MPILNSLARAAVKPLPTMVSAKAHATIDYFTIGIFLLSAGFFWQRSKRAALGSLICGASELAVNLLTDYPGGVRRVISFRAHRSMDFGLAAMTATMPQFLAFEDESERKFFLIQGAVIAAATELTQFPDKGGRAEKGKLREKAS
jgi:hypothetical protein